MPFCVQCGAKLEEGAKFCTVCGAKQPETAAPVNIPPASAGADRQSSYTYDPTIYAGRGAGESKPPRKKGGALVFILLAALVVIAALVFIFTGRGGSKAAADDPVLGLYTAQKAETAGISISINTMWKDGFTIELKDKGKAQINVDGKSGSAKWTLDDETFTIKGSGVDCSGTLSDGVLTLENVMDTGVTLFFTKDGVSLPSDETPAPAPAPDPEPAPGTAPGGETAPVDPSGILGLYNADKAVAYGVEIEISTMWEKGFSIELLEGGKCNLSVDGNKGSGKWSLNGETLSVNVPGFVMDGTLSDGVLCFEDLYGMGVSLYFTRDGSMLPAAKSAQPTVPSGWAGSWYGWWSVNDCGGVYAENDYGNSYWDACAIIEDNGDGTGSVEIWDEDNDYVAVGDVTYGPGETAIGSMSNGSVQFWDYEIPAGEWAVDPGSELNSRFANSIIISGRYVDPENEGSWFDYNIFLRPWGTRWDDMDADMIPYYYDSWYLPLIDADEAMPDLFEGLD